MQFIFAAKEKQVILNTLGAGYTLGAGRVNQMKICTLGKIDGDEK
jgi:hypothetical protein